LGIEGGLESKPRLRARHKRWEYIPSEATETLRSAIVLKEFSWSLRSSVEDRPPCGAKAANDHFDPLQMKPRIGVKVAIANDLSCAIYGILKT